MKSHEPKIPLVIVGLNFGRHIVEPLRIVAAMAEPEQIGYSVEVRY